MRALVLGGYGAVGAEVASQLRAGGDDCPVAGRDPARADQVVDLHEPGAAIYRTALGGVDVVVNAAGLRDPGAGGDRHRARRSLRRHHRHLRLHRCDGAPQAAPAGPGLCRPGTGLTNLLAAAVHHSEPGPIDIALLVGAGERYDAAATAWSYGCSASASGIQRAAGAQLCCLPA